MSTRTWVLIGILILVVILGGWWLIAGEQTTLPMMAQTSGVATTSETSGAGPVAVVSSSKTVAALVASSSYGATFNSLLSQTGLLSSISGKGPYTVFVASNGAFDRVAPGIISSMSAAQLKRLVEYHIVSGKSLEISANFSGEVTALSGDILNFQVNTTTHAVYVNSGYVLAAYKASNGMVYVINSVLLPPTKSTQ
jgi:uncharacterized surface protein with fasciclin (FAS1) repeats